MARLPQPGGDNGNWGDILNEYLSQALKPTGQLKDNVVTASAIAPNSVTSAAIATDAVNAVSIADGSITNTLLADDTVQEAKLSSALRTKLNSGASSPDWNMITNKPAVIASGADQTAARAAIGAGVSNLVLGTTSTTAKAGDYIPTKADVGLSNVDNTSDANKPVSTATQTALNAKQNTPTGTPNGNKFLRDDNSWQSVPAASDATTSSKGIVQLAGDLGGTATNPTVPGLAGKEPTLTAGTTSQYYRGDKTWQNLDKSAVGLANVDNTSDATKNSATATLTNKTLSNPRVNALRDANGNIAVDLIGITSAVNHYYVTNQVSGIYPTIGVDGSDANIGISLAPKGSGPIRINAASGNTPTIDVAGPDTNLDLNLVTKGGGQVKINGTAIATDSNVVHKSGNETIAGNKSFMGSADFNQISYFKEVVIEPTNPGDTAALQLDNDNGQVWLNGNNSGGTFAIVDQTNNSTPFYIQPDSPDQSFTITAGGLNANQQLNMNGNTILNATFDSTNDVTFNDTGFTLQDDVDFTKKMKFQLSGLTTNTTRTLTIPDANTTVVGTDTTQTLTNKSLTTPRIDQIKDTFGVPIIDLDGDATSTNYLQIGNSNGGSPWLEAKGNSTNINLDITPKGSGVVNIWTYAGTTPTLVAEGDDANLDLNLRAKGTGKVKVSGVDVVTISGTQTLTSKTLTSPVINGTISGTGIATAATASTIASRDGNANIIADAFVPGLTSTVTSGGTTTLTIDSTEIQAFTGTAAQTVTLPNTGVVAGQRYTILGQSTGAVTVAASGGGTINVLLGTASLTGTYVALQATPTLPTHWAAELKSNFAISTPVTASSIPRRDGSASLSANAFIPNFVTTATASATTTLTISSAEVQVFTGSTTQTVILPTTSIVAGQRYTLVNQSTSAISVQTSDTTVIATLSAGHSFVVTALQASPTSSTHWSLAQATNLPFRSSATNSSGALRDNNANLSANNFLSSSQSIATAAGTTTLSIVSAQTLIFTGTNTQTVLLPSVSVGPGQTYTIVNQSTGALTVQSSGANTITTMATSRITVFTANISTPTTAAHWTATSMTTGTNMVFPTTSATIARTDAAQTFTGTQTFNNPPSFSSVPGGAGVATAATASTLAARDGNGYIFASNLVNGFATTVTAAGTTTLTIASKGIQVFTGTSTQTVMLPTTSIIAGGQYTIINQSTGAVTVQSSGANTVTTLNGGMSAILSALVATPTTAAQWNAQVFGSSTQPRVTTITSSATPAINTDTTDLATITAQAVAITSMSSGLTGSPANGQKLMIRIKDNGSPQSIVWGASFVSSGIVTLLSATVAGKAHHVGLMYDSVVAKWVCIAVDATGY